MLEENKNTENENTTLKKVEFSENPKIVILFPENHCDGLSKSAIIGLIENLAKKKLNIGLCLEVNNQISSQEDLRSFFFESNKTRRQNDGILGNDSPREILYTEDERGHLSKFFKENNIKFYAIDNKLEFEVDLADSFKSLNSRNVEMVSGIKKCLEEADIAIVNIGLLHGRSFELESLKVEGMLELLKKEGIKTIQFECCRFLSKEDNNNRESPFYKNLYPNLEEKLPNFKFKENSKDVRLVLGPDEKKMEEIIANLAKEIVQFFKGEIGEEEIQRVYYENGKYLINRKQPSEKENKNYHGDIKKVNEKVDAECCSVM